MEIRSIEWDPEQITLNENQKRLNVRNAIKEFLPNYLHQTKPISINDKKTKLHRHSQEISEKNGQKLQEKKLVKAPAKPSRKFHESSIESFYKKPDVSIDDSNKLLTKKTETASNGLKKTESTDVKKHVSTKTIDLTNVTNLPELSKPSVLTIIHAKEESDCETSNNSSNDSKGKQTHDSMKSEHLTKFSKQSHVYRCSTK